MTCDTGADGSRSKGCFTAGEPGGVPAPGRWRCKRRARPATPEPRNNHHTEQDSCQEDAHDRYGRPDAPWLVEDVRIGWIARIGHRYRTLWTIAEGDGSIRN
jgi:hypothetical protein